MENITTTPFSIIYDSFLSKIVDDMYLEFTELYNEPAFETGLL